MASWPPGASCARDQDGLDLGGRVPLGLGRKDEFDEMSSRIRTGLRGPRGSLGGMDEHALFPRPVPFLPRCSELVSGMSGRRRGRAVARARSEAVVNVLVGYFNYVVLGSPKSLTRYYPLGLRRGFCTTRNSSPSKLTRLHARTYGRLSSRQRHLSDQLVAQILPMLRSKAHFEGALGRGAASLSTILDLLARDSYSPELQDLNALGDVAGQVKVEEVKLPVRAGSFSPDRTLSGDRFETWHHMEERISKPPSDWGDTSRRAMLISEE